AIELVRLQTLEPNRRFEFTCLDRKSRQQASGYERLENDALAAGEFRVEAEVVVVVDRAFDDGADFTQQECVGRLWRAVIQEPTAIHGQIAAEADDIGVIRTGEREASGPCLD